MGTSDQDWLDLAGSPSGCANTTDIMVNGGTSVLPMDMVPCPGFNIGVRA